MKGQGRDRQNDKQRERKGEERELGRSCTFKKTFKMLQIWGEYL